MDLFKGKHKQKPANDAGSKAKEPIAGNRNWLRGWLGKKGREVQADARSIASSAAGQTRSEHCEGGSQASVAGCDPLKDHEELDTMQSLWDRAYDALKTKDPQLVENYEKLLSKELSKTSDNSNESSSDPPDPVEESLDKADNRIKANLQERRAQLDTIIEGGMQRMDEKRVKYNIAGHEYVLQDQIAQAAKLVQWAKAWIGDAVKDSPQASMAWAGVCIILPLLTKPSTADQANRDGFTYVTARMRYYVALEPLLLPQSCNPTSATVSEKLIAEFETHIVDLYQHILDFQFRSVLRFYRGRLGNLERDLFQHEDWNEMRSTIDGLETIVRKDSEQINTSTSRQILENLNQNAKGSLETIKQLLPIAKKQLQVTEELLGISSEQLQVQKEIAKKMLSQDEEKCH